MEKNTNAKEEEGEYRELLNGDEIIAGDAAVAVGAGVLGRAGILERNLDDGQGPERRRTRRRRRRRGGRSVEEGLAEADVGEELGE